MDTNNRLRKWNSIHGLNTVSDRNQSEEQVLRNVSFAESFLAKEKSLKIPEDIENVIKEAKVKAGVWNVAKVVQ